MYNEDISLLLRQLSMALAIADEAGLTMAGIHIENARQAVLDTAPQDRCLAA